MSERRMGPTISAGAWKLVPIEEVRVNQICWKSRFSVFFAKSPAAVVAVRNDRESPDVTASDMKGHALDVAALAKEVPGLQDRLDELKMS